MVRHMFLSPQPEGPKRAALLPSLQVTLVMPPKPHASTSGAEAVVRLCPCFFTSTSLAPHLGRNLAEEFVADVDVIVLGH